QVDSTVDGVKFHLENPDVTPEQSHENWLKLKLVEGWVFGEKKNGDKKEHPCCVPYADLPSEQKVKDALFSAILSALR
ncbi:hypothetical protein LCGC14_2424870, partial [marine sediment metagenome]